MMHMGWRYGFTFLLGCVNVAAACLEVRPGWKAMAVTFAVFCITSSVCDTICAAIRKEKP